jgi:hypothetical protein
MPGGWPGEVALSQDKIRWRRFIEEVISKEITQMLHSQRVTYESGKVVLRIDHPAKWLYRNYVVHDPVSGIIATVRKEELLLEIERQRELEDTGLLEEDKYLAEVNLEEITSYSGDRRHYWLLAIQTAQKSLCIKGAMGVPTNGER